ncbi:hypothetical protein Ddye_014774 [Dipteronia dyeriana]|uniref:DUF8040 domain-containing protein n=1 Tax=Dipteronia dyeriana TaxID=168575 RepID=A0AAD9U3I8_9ROSI|nr:hypothetical protein Ddye_014774 [Dipteronia dyeriana]
MVIWISHSVRMRVTAERFQRYNDTIHRQFKRVLKAVYEKIETKKKDERRKKKNKEEDYGREKNMVMVDWTSDSGYSNMLSFLATYRGERYHLRDCRGSTRALKGPTELFNYRYSYMCNVIKRCFGVLNARFSILEMPNYPPLRQ